MNGPEQQSTQRRYWPRMQFSMWTMLVMMFVVAMGVNTYLKFVVPYRGMSERKLADGSVIRFQLVKHDPASDRSDDEIAHGRFVVTDKFDRILCRGRFFDNYPVGRWTLYHLSGRKALTGQCDEGQRNRLWTAWHANGRKALQIEHGLPIENRSDPQEFYHLSATNNLFDTTMLPVRHGSAIWWWDNGKPRAEGRFNNDHRDGTWKFYDRDGRLIAVGEYRDSLRHGPWKVADEAGKLRDVYYVDGQSIENVQQIVARHTKSLHSADFYESNHAFRRLGQIGKQAVPALVEVLASDSNGPRLQAVEQLANIGPDAKEALSALIPLTKHDNPLLRAKATRAVYAIDESSKAAMFEALVKQVYRTHGWERRQTIQQLALLGSSALPRIENLLERDKLNGQLVALLALKAMYELEEYSGSEIASKVIAIAEQAASQENEQLSTLAKELVKEFKRAEKRKRERETVFPIIRHPVVG